MAKESSLDYGRELYELMIRKGYPEDFSRLISSELHTEFTGKRMIGYLSARGGTLPLEEVADEMMAILSDRERLVKKHIAQDAQSYINKMYMEGFGEPGEEVEDEEVDDEDSEDLEEE